MTDETNTALLALQDLDTRIEQIRHRFDTLAERTTRDTAVATERALVGELAPVVAQRAAVATEQRRLEREAAAVEDKLAQVDRQLYGGAIVAHKELEALQHEVGTLKDRLGDFETGVLEQMELAEPLDARIVELEQAIESQRMAVSVSTAELEVIEAATTAELDDAVAARAAAAATVPDELTRVYEGLRRSHGGVGAARLEGSRCLGCHLEIPPGEMVGVKKAPADEVVFCPECGRILVR